MIKILAIETSCDETAVCVLDANRLTDNQVDFNVLGNITLSQIEQHREFGGVYPNLARREHVKNLLPIMNQVFTDSKIELGSIQLSVENEAKVRDYLAREPGLADQLIEWAVNHNPVNIDCITVTAGPGLAPALWVGVNVARSLALLWNKPLIATNHMAGHIVSGLYPDKEMKLPALSLLVSGGHTEIVSVQSATNFKKIGKTLDDAAGEAFDKIARILGLPYPGGPEISKLAIQHRDQFPEYQHICDLPFPMRHSGDLNFSFSGLKTACKKIIDASDLTPEFIAGFSREFEETVVNILVTKLTSAINKYCPNQILCGGGVLANAYLRSKLETLSQEKGVEILFPSPRLSGDNAIMIAMAGYFKAEQKQYVHPDKLTAISSWSIDTIFL